MNDYRNRESKNYVNDPEIKQIDLAIEKACLRGDLKSVESNPIAKIALAAALDF